MEFDWHMFWRIFTPWAGIGGWTYAWLYWILSAELDHNGDDRFEPIDYRNLI